MSGNYSKWMWPLIVVLAVVAIGATFSNRFLGLDTRPRFGLDIQGGVRVVLRAKKEEYKGGKWDFSKLEAVRHIIENRVNGYGVSEPTIITKPDDQIIVELPGLKNEREALDRLQSTASMVFYLLPELGTRDGGGGIWSVSQHEDPTTHQKTDTLIDNSTGAPVSPQILQDRVFSREPIATGNEMLPNCAATIQPSSSNPVIDFEFNAKGAEAFERVTRANKGKFLAIFLDKKLLTAPSINGVIPGGHGIIEGAFTLESAKQLADQLNAGALPVPLETLETRKLEATLGREAVHATTVAGIIGLSLVLLFMVVYYRLPGLLANGALVLYTLFSVAIFKGLLGPIGVPAITLTLPGIAGFILSIGMAVDANILIFERLKEEIRSGKTLRNAVQVGFNRAWSAIRDSNVCTLITCAILYSFGTGPIRGFAMTLGLGVLVSMFTAITVSRTFLASFVTLQFAQNPALYGLNVQFSPRWHVMRWWKLWLGISGLIIVPGMVFWAAGGIKPSIDFKGGTELQVPFAQRHASDAIQRALVSIDPKFKDSHVVVSGEGASQLAYVTTEQLSDAQRDEVEKALLDKVGPLAPGQNIAYANVSGTISKELTQNAITAVIVASILIVLYLALRFAIGGFVEGLKYGTCAVIALLHDVLVVWGAFAILGKALGWQIDSLFVTAMLTVIGFSVHDTIIIFDRIRENLAHRAKGESFSDLVDRSVNQTIARSINTSFTVVLTLLALFFFGGATVHQFTGALLIGIVSGTYSSIFNASVLLVLWKHRDMGQSLATAGVPSRAAATVKPGDRPLVTPPASSGFTPSPAIPNGKSDSAAAARDKEPATGPRATTPRRQSPGRRRRM